MPLRQCLALTFQRVISGGTNGEGLAAAALPSGVLRERRSG